MRAAFPSSRPAAVTALTPTLVAAVEPRGRGTRGPKERGCAQEQDIRRLDRILPGLAAVALSVALAAPRLAHGGRDRQAFASSQHLEVVPDPGPCDVVITPANQAATLPLLNDADKRVFCVDAGDYRAAGHVELRSSGSPSARRYLRFNAPFPVPPAIGQTSRAIFQGLLLNEASFWVIEGIAVQPSGLQTYAYLVAILGGARNVLDGNLFDASLQVNYTRQNGVVVAATGAGVPSTRNSIQHNVIRGGNRTRLPIDYTGVSITSEPIAGAFNDYNKVLDNEIYDWGDGIQLSAPSDCSDPARPRGTIIDGNDIYVTDAKRARCSDGAYDPTGECACAENGIDVKTSAGVRSDRWTRITRNRLWGFRPTVREAPSCGGSGSRGQAITAGNACASHVFVAGNVILDSTIGILAEGGEWRIAGNLLSEIRTHDAANGNLGIAIYPLSGAGSLVQFNTVVGVDNAYQDTAADVAAQCNAVIHDRALNGASGPRGAGHVVRDNHLYESGSPNNLVDPTTAVFATAAESLDRQLCFLRRRWTAPEEVCVPLGRTTAASPHATPPPECATDLGAEFGIPAITYP
jgi:hypothetical protein